MGKGSKKLIGCYRPRRLFGATCGPVCSDAVTNIRCFSFAHTSCWLWVYSYRSLLILENILKWCHGPGLAAAYRFELRLYPRCFLVISLKKKYEGISQYEETPGVFLSAVFDATCRRYEVRIWNYLIPQQFRVISPATHRYMYLHWKSFEIWQSHHD